MFDRIRKFTNATFLRALTANSIPCGFDQSLQALVFKDENGNTRVIGQNVNGPISAAAATLALAPQTHSGRRILLNRSTGIAVTLPAATGSGAKYSLCVATALASGTYAVAVANASDYMRGAAYETADDSSGATKAWPTADTGTVATESDTFTLNGTTKGGIVGDDFTFEDIAANVWSVRGFINATGTEVSPFSAAV